VTEPADQSSEPPRTWRPMALWTVGILLALGACWSVAKAIQLYQTHKLFDFGCSGYDAPLDRLGRGPQAISRLNEYRSLPTRLIGGDKKERATALLGYCGSKALPPLLAAAHNSEACVRRGAALGLLYLIADGCEDPAALKTLRSLADDPDADVRKTAKMMLEDLGQATTTPPEQ
jgi:hypothetical protein